MSHAVGDVIAANQAFYDAFANGDMQAMAAIWAAAAPVACIHPGAPLLTGRETVVESWSAILEAASRPEIECLQPQAHLLGDAAFVTCYERLGGAAGATLLATNVFVLEDGHWRLTHHHASPTLMTPARAASQWRDRLH